MEKPCKRTSSTVDGSGTSTQFNLNSGSFQFGELEPRSRDVSRSKKKKLRTVKKQLHELSLDNRNTFYSLKIRWTGTVGNNPRLPDSLLLRYARHHSFDEQSTWNAIWKIQKPDIRRMLTLDVASVATQLRSRTLFPLPGMRTRNNEEVFYMKPSRYSPKSTPTNEIIDTLVFVLNSMMEKEANATSGVGFIANMDDWTFEHFSVDYCKKFMEMLQGQIFPFQIKVFLIVNPPPWFGQVWSIMKPMLARDFQKKVHMIPESELFEHLQFGYERFLPDDLLSGKAPSEVIVEDFIQKRLVLEKSRVPRDMFGSQASESSLTSSDGTLPPEVATGCYCGLFRKLSSLKAEGRQFDAPPVRSTAIRHATALPHAA